MDLSNLDPETRSLVIRLHLEDVHAIQASSQNQKGKRRLGETDDFEAGLDAYKTELASAAQSFADHAICESIDRAVRSDAELIQLSLREEEQSARDREMALRSSQGGSRGAVSTTRSMCTHPAPTSASEDLVKRFQDLRCDLADEGEDASGQPVSSAWAARRRQPVSSSEPRQRTKVCIACRDRQYDADVAACPCSHYYCRGCLDSLFRASLTDETLFPPRCCGQNIPPDVYRGLVDDAQFIGTFRAKKIEFETPNRTYCHEPTCSTFVPPQSIAGDVATCVRCRSQTCTICKARAHQGSDCPQDPALQETLRLAAEQGWQRCGSCQSVVELQHGCNHMTCRCGYQFCYVCGQRWKTCSCSQWDEERLLSRANAIVDRDAGAARMGAQWRADLVEREAGNLRANHQCQHRNWRSRGGLFRCEECRDTLPNYIYECATCRVLACRRCRFNRLQV